MRGTIGEIQFSFPIQCPTITSRGEMDTKFRSEIYTQCIAIGEAMAFMPLIANRCNINRTVASITEPPIQTCLMRTWNNLTTPLHYGAAARIRECKNQRTGAIPLLEELCLKRVFSILAENRKLSPHQWKQLPLPPWWSLKWWEFSLQQNPCSMSPTPHMTMCQEYVCKCPEDMPSETVSCNEKKYSQSMMKKICAPSRWVTAQKINKKFSIYLLDYDMVDANQNCGVEVMERFQTTFKAF